MNNPAHQRGRVAVIGAGPAGMATALSVHQAGHDVILLERYPQARPAGNILNLWPAPIKALGLLGVDIDDLGSPCQSEFRSATGHRRVLVNLPDDIIRDSAAASSVFCVPTCTSGCWPSSHRACFSSIARSRASTKTKVRCACTCRTAR